MNPESRYELLEKIATGSFATVYRARDLELGREVAVKQIHAQYLDDPRQLDRYWQEAQLVASLQHPNIVTIYDVVRPRGWLVMELMQKNLSSAAHGRGMDPKAVRTILAHTLRALRFLHEHGVVHGDIKPSNLLLDRRGRIKLGDFGLARRVSDSEGSLIKGTTRYMAPEVVSEDFGDVGPASDLYSLGVTAYELLCGRLYEDLFPGLSGFARDMQAAWMMWHAAPDRRLPDIRRVRPDLPEDVARTVMKLTAKPQSERYSQAEQALADLEVDVRPGKAEEQAAAAPAPAADGRRRWLVIAAFVASVTFSLAVAFWPSGGPKTPAYLGRSFIIREIRQETGELIVNDERDGTADKLKLGKKPRLFLVNTQQLILPEELKPGDRIQLRARDKNQGFELRVSRPYTSHAAFRRYDAGSRQLVVQVEEGQHRAELILQIDDGTKVLLNGEPARPDQFAPGDRIEAVHLADLKSDTLHQTLELHARRLVEQTGLIETADLAAKNLTYRMGQGLNSTVVTVPFSDKVKVRLGDKPPVPLEAVGADDLRPRDRVQVRRDSEIHELVATRSQTMTGTVFDVDPAARRLVVQEDSGKRTTFRVLESSSILLGGEPARLEWIARYDPLTVTYDTVAGESRPFVIDATRPVQTDRWAVIVGVQACEDPAISRPPYAAADARLLHQVLLKQYGFAGERLRLLIDPTRERFERELDVVLGAALGPTQVIVFYAGQGYGSGGETSLVLADTRLDRLAETGFPLKDLLGRMARCVAAEKLLLLDASHAGPGEDVRGQPSSEEMLAGVRASDPAAFIRTWGVAACRAGETSLESKTLGHGLFTWHLAEAFRGAADADRSLRITAGELEAWLGGNFDAGLAGPMSVQRPAVVGPP